MFAHKIVTKVSLKTRENGLNFANNGRSFAMKTREAKSLVTVYEQLFSQSMPRLKCKLNSVKAHKYSSLWFALKASQRTPVFKNINNDLNQHLNDNNDYIEMNQSNGNFSICSDDNELMEQISDSTDSCVKTKTRNSTENSFNNRRLEDIEGIQFIEIDCKSCLVVINKIKSTYEITFGCLRLTQLTNNSNICINGFTLLTDKSIELMAVFGYKISIKCRINETDDKQDINEIKRKLESLPIESTRIELLLSRLETNKSVILLIERLCLSSILFLETFANFKPLNNNRESDWFKFQNEGKDSFIYFSKWDSLFSELNLNTNDIIMVCGGKDVGKSSLIRYLINKYLSNNSTDDNSNEILYLDCDPGQTEFTTSGQISLTAIDKPILGSSSTNLTNFKSLISCSIGSISVTPNPKLYISSIEFIMNYISNNLQSKGPLFINTMGWTRDLGLALIIDIIKITSPTHVIQINSNFMLDKKKNFTQDLSAKSVMRYQGFRFKPMDKNIQLNYKLSVINSKFAKFCNKVQAKSNRTFKQLSYISGLSDIIFKPIFSMTPFKIYWSQVFLHIVTDSPIAHELMLDIVNCSWIQLCKIDDKLLSPSNVTQLNGLRVVDRLFENQCFGCAIIRGIDIENMCFYLISPETLQTISSINCIVRPYGLPIPESIVLDQLKYSSSSNLPYIYDKT